MTAPSVATTAYRGFLFADLRGYAAFVERHGDAAAAQLLERYRVLVREVVARFGGAEIKTEGDSFLAVLWFGGHITRVLFVEPIVRTLPEASQAQFNAALHKRGIIFVPIIAGVGVTGILRGTVFGPIKSVHVLLGTPYGLTFLAAIAFGLLAFYPAKPAWMMRLKADHVGFFGAFTAMILMHFGL